MSDFSFISNAHPAYIESMYVRFLENPTSIDPEWYHFFKGFEFAKPSTTGFTDSKCDGFGANSR